MRKRIIIIGGKLQGSEVAYLGKEAGFEVVLIDKNPYAPARKLCDLFVCADVRAPGWEVKDLLKSADLIIPTMENYEVLDYIVSLSEKLKLKLAFDWDAYKISSSKVISDQLFHHNGLPAPKYYPGGDYPYFAKPGADSGSHGVRFIESEADLKEFAMKKPGDYIIQEYIEGPSYSVEVIGFPGNYRTYELTEILVDESYDCNSVTALRNVAPKIDDEIRQIAVVIAEIIQLKGIMDLEVIVNNGQVKILEIDARFPSQTPIVVYHASGMNYVTELYDLFTTGDFQKKKTDSNKFASLIHYYVNNDTYSSQGEHIMVEGGALDYTYGVCEGSIVISDYVKGKRVWRGAFINYADTTAELSEKTRNLGRSLDKILLLNKQVG